MKEVVFIRKNIEKWRKMEDVTSSLESLSPDAIADAYQEVSADLAFAQTHYPESEIVPYLNAMALKLHNKIYGYRQQRLNRIWHFWSHEIPHEMYCHRRLMLLSLIIFVVSVIIGVVSTIGNPDFPRDILGNYYVNNSLRNIESGNPMGVYGSNSPHTLMYQITLNNIGVSFMAFIGGLLTCYCTGFLILRNGVMLGCFMTFFYQHHVLKDCLLAVWMHGVFEISAIIVAGGAGLILGCGWLFPGSLPRGTSFRLAARSGTKIVVGLIPMFFVAGFIESFVTRYTDAPDAFRLSVIFGSLVLVILYFIILPYKRRHG